MIFLYLLIFTLAIVYSNSSLLPFRKTYSKSHDTDADSNSQRVTSSRYSVENDQCLTCNVTLIAPKKVINPYKEEMNNVVPKKPFGSFCIKCAACLAVANQIENIIKESSEECETDPEKRKILQEDILKKIDDLCIRGFKKSFKNHNVITDNFHCTEHVESNMDGHWTKKLREICLLYVSHVNMGELSINILNNNENLTDIFCRNTGIFRDCINIQSHQNIALPNCDTCNC